MINKIVTPQEFDFFVEAINYRRRNENASSVI
jgi:hypothetical protein